MGTTTGAPVNQPKNPHEVIEITWQISNLMIGMKANSTTIQAAPSEGFPDLYVDLCDLVGTDWDLSE